ncbi:DUF3526 domain-containing protein [Bryobacter aggregatus]|uniref:DUF3526 domain-containing protein n=1 Tax=Bryobacter aggregatus TaxID=360054 RepID=UPI0004E10883|nr:DUF3526 domain-containing protein [Bryobacter aggregatus]
MTSPIAFGSSRLGRTPYVLQGLLLVALVALIVFASSVSAGIGQTETTLQRYSMKEPQVADPGSVYVEVTLPPPALLQLSSGLVGMAPSMHLIRLLATRPLTNVDVIEHPARRRYGRVDLSFVFLLVLPIAILPICFFLYRQCLASGAIEKLLSGKVSMFDFCIERILMPLGVFSGVIILSTLASLYASGMQIGSNERLGRLSFWVAIVSVYLLGWLLLFAWLLLRGSSFAGAAIRYTGIFLISVIGVPFLLQSIGSAIARPQSRLEISIDRRNLSKTIQLPEQAVVDQFLQSQGAPAIDWSQPLGNTRLIALKSLMVEEQLRPKVEAFESSVRRMEQLSQIGSWLSPYTVTQFAVDDLAGSGLSRYTEFREAAIVFFQQWKTYLLPYLSTKQTLDFDALRGAPKFQMKPENSGMLFGVSAIRFLYLGVIAGTLVVLLRRELQRVLPKRANAAR